MHSTGYIIRFIIIITALSALTLAFLSTTLAERHERNEQVFNKRGILSAIEEPLGEKISSLSDKQVQELFDNQVTQEVLNMKGQEVGSEAVLAHGYAGGKAEDVDMAKERKLPESQRLLPLFVFENKGKKYYILAVRGNGLWDEIWGYVALDDDFNTIAGAGFDHKGETPGLGAEIKDNPAFHKQFEGKKIFAPDGTYTSVIVRKGGAKNPRDEVDAISGATITSNGVTEMLYRGIKYYLPYFDSLKTEQ